MAKAATGVASGRIDLMGGVADYSGACVLEVATRVATTVQATLAPAAPAADALELESGPFGRVAVPLEPLRARVAAGDAAGIDARAIGAWLRERGVPHWAAYPYGCLALWARETGWLPPRDSTLSLAISSDVPTSQGVSSSASVEVATLRALVAVSGIERTQLRLAHLGQAAENYVVGAPCGLMDQLASACGAPGRVLPIVCRPDLLEEPVPLPAGVIAVGWPSGVKHSVAASPYLVARTATFMGRRMAEAALGRTFAHAAEIAPSLFAWRLAAGARDALPASITGAAFTAAYGPLADGLSKVEPEREYAVAASLRFPIEESHRCALAASLLRAAAGAPRADAVRLLTQVGELMLQSHAGYTAIGLGADETDVIVEALMARLGPAAGVYGARISGGGSGGTVAVLADEAALPAIDALARELKFEGAEPFTGLIR